MPNLQAGVHTQPDEPLESVIYLVSQQICHPYGGTCFLSESDIDRKAEDLLDLLPVTHNHSFKDRYTIRSSCMSGKPVLSCIPFLFCPV